MKIPFQIELEKSERILLAGAGGGYDIFSGLPLYFDLLEQGKTVYLANLSFTDIWSSTAKPFGDYAVEVTAKTRGRENYFPELHLARWLSNYGYKSAIFAFDNLGVTQLRESYELLIQNFDIDTVILVDGGTDSLMRGDEADLGTPQEDAASIAALHYLDTNVQKYLICLGFGIDAHHGVPHYDVLEAVSALTLTEDYLGAISLMPSMSSVRKFREASYYTFEKMPTHPSIIVASALDAIYGEFGNFHRTKRTQGSELFINPLMSLYWTFKLDGIAQRNLYLEKIKNAETYSQLRYEIEVFRTNLKTIKSRKAIPL